jgi:TRAP transporter 4TM/12TM fusion protein
VKENGLKTEKRFSIALLMSALGVICSLFMLANLTLVIIETWVIEIILLSLIVILGIYYHPFSKALLGRALDWGIIAATVFCAAYVLSDIERLIYLGQTFPTITDQFVFTVGIVIVLEMSRRVVGWVLPGVAIICILYAFFGDHIGGLWGHPGFQFARITGHIYSENGIFTVPMRVVVRYIYLFLIFSAFLGLSGVGDTIIAMANGLAGRTRGGPAKVAIIASALFGSISGSALANVGTTGSFTIPMMKRIGYRPDFAAAVEAVASTGGQWMPPVMAGAAFILAEYVELPYRQVMIAAFVPALLYYLCLGLQIDLEAIKLKLQGLKPEETPRVGSVLKKSGYLFFPLVLLLIDLLLFDHSVIHAALYATASCILVSWVRKATRMGPRKILQALDNGARASIVVTICCACAGIIIGVLNLTGIGVRLGSLMVAISHGNGLIMLLFTGIVALILGMGMPTTGAYIVCASVMAPGLVLVGLPLFPVHLFILYYAVINCITPPVALAAYTAASLAGSSPLQTAIIATRLGIVAYFVPLLFIFNPGLLLMGGLGKILASIGLAVVGVVVLAMVLNGRFYAYGITWSFWQRILLLGAAVGVFFPHENYQRTGLGLLVVAIASNRTLLKWIGARFKKERNLTPKSMYD